MNIDFNILLDTDSYKASHWLQYPPGTTAMYSYLESRGGKYKKTTFFGLQYIMKRYLTTKITEEMVEEAKAFWEAHGEPFNYEGWMYIAKNLAGRIPMRIRAVPEGTAVTARNVLMDCESTDEKCFWVESWFETMLMRVWYPTTVATLSLHCREIIMAALEKSSDNPAAEQPFKHHDFGSRGVSSLESAMIGGAAHLVHSMGSDTAPGVWMANKFYGCKGGMAGYSIPAAEHSTITSWGKRRESEAYRNMLKQYGGTGKILAVVSDSYDYFNAVGNIWGKELITEVLDANCTLVIRPDSGDPVEMIIKGLRLLEHSFGATLNTKGYKIINHNVRLIQGDGIDIEVMADILNEVMWAGYSATNVAFGMGGGLLQKVDRDTQKFAYKCSEITIDGEHIPVFKDPVTDPGKKSKAGRLMLVHDGVTFTTMQQGDLAPEFDQLKVVYEDGIVVKEYNFDEVRANAAL